MPYPEHDLLNMANVVSMPYQGKQAVTREAITIYDQIRIWDQFSSLLVNQPSPSKQTAFYCMLQPDYNFLQRLLYLN